MASDAQEPHPARELLSAWRARGPDRRLRRLLQPSAIPREHRQPDTGRRLLRTRPDHPPGKRKDQTTDHPEPTLEPPQHRRITSTNRCARASLLLSSDLSQLSDDGHVACWKALSDALR